MISFKALGALLDYPTEQMQAAADEIEQALIAEQALPAADLIDVGAFIERLRTTDIMDLQEYWVSLFDRSKRLALHLHEHSYGESRDRGQAMVDLALTYRMNGFELAASEMPDYLPLFCEFLSQVPEAAARRYLGEAVEIVEALRIRLEERESPYAALLGALVSLSTKAADTAEVDAILVGEPEDPKTLDELDAQWAEDPVTFGAGAAMNDCAYAGDLARKRAAEIGREAA
ncbi:nitrate reductase molybdenum cofactor assembly chaperone [Sphingomonas sp. KRR8]|uniref:nitrate reductase molybdenum cofactor assembly chaperone n=1 Tax=Sphingomonas sp. KRR8 TaxID=2942996 RepID=UPI002020C0E5|nr:nitrate reductase molybdenum cofactor assembly chaperone [Sphingomonas sp. KRR8]URD59796.1 nitrate reductase molybdenum cofactor assembly chaperone [Sphingomonas sp. KRR8]